MFQRLRLSNGDESVALGEILRWRRAQCEGRGDWKHRPPRASTLPPTLLWTNRKASPWQRLCDAVTWIGYEVPPLSSVTLPHCSLCSFLFIFCGPSIRSAPGLGCHIKPQGMSLVPGLPLLFWLRLWRLPQLKAYDRNTALCDTNKC